MWSENKMYQKLISDYIVHKLHSKFRIHTICIYRDTTELKLPISHTAAYRSTTESNANQILLNVYMYIYNISKKRHTKFIYIYIYVYLYIYIYI